MTYFPDLSNYSYGSTREIGRPVRNIGWLDPGSSFQTGEVDPEFLSRLWQFCTVSILQTRGLHECEICRSRSANTAERDGLQLLLGSAEIRVFSSSGDIYAAPNLIYHYAAIHRYMPPAEFVDAVRRGPCPPDPDYFAKLSEVGEAWSPTLRPEPGAKSFRFVKTDKGVIRVEE
jgi:hypothetical protein